MVREIAVKDIKVGYRIRKEQNDIAELADNIKTLGLINPITVMQEADGGYLLLAGYRRLQAVGMLCMKKVMANILTPQESDRQLMIEIAENEQRKDFTSAERLEYAERIRAVEAAKAKERMAAHARDGYSSKQSSQGVAVRPHPESEKGGKTRDIVAKKAGFTSQQQMQRTKYIANHKPELLDEIDSGKKSVFVAYKEAKAEVDHDPYADVPQRPSTYDSFKNTKSDREELKAIEERLVAPEKVKPFEVYTAYKPEECEGFVKYMRSPCYAELYKQYKLCVEYGNRIRREAEWRCEQYAKEIRSLKENLQYCQRRIKELEACANGTSSSDS